MAITGVVTIVATIISFLVFLFGEGVFRENTSAQLMTPTFLTMQTAVLATELPYQKVEINESVSSLNGETVVTVKYLEFQKDTLLIRMTIDNSQSPLNTLACGLPKLIKSQYGDLLIFEK